MSTWNCGHLLTLIYWISYCNTFTLSLTFLHRSSPTLAFFSSALKLVNRFAFTAMGTSSHLWAINSHRVLTRALGQMNWKRWNATWKTGTLDQVAPPLETAGEDVLYENSDCLTHKQSSWTHKGKNPTYLQYILSAKAYLFQNAVIGIESIVSFHLLSFFHNVFRLMMCLKMNYLCMGIFLILLH